MSAGMWQIPGMNPGTQLRFAQFGKPAETLEVAEFSPRPPEAGEVLLRILAAPVNPADLNTIEGTYGVKPALPAVPGIEGCGEVVESGSPDYQPGDRVIFLRRAATWSTHTTVAADSLFKLPAGIDPVQAAMLKVNPATAWQLLHGFEKLTKGDWIVQNLGNSAVGRCVIQIARDLGIHTVSFVRNADQFAGLKSLGADHVLLDDEDGFAAAKEILGGANAALAFNAVGGDSALRLMKLLRLSGTHVTYGAMGRKPITLPNGLLLFQDIRVRGLWVTRWVENASSEEVRATYQDLASRVAAGKLVQPVDGTFPLEKFQDALARLDAPERDGKVLFAP
jgi:NADPH:quinone reductase-like Zn-dependent oxidoreductase